MLPSIYPLVDRGGFKSTLSFGCFYSVGSLQFHHVDHENPMPRAMAAATKGMNKRTNTSARNHR